MKALFITTTFASSLLLLAGCQNELKDDGSRNFSDVMTIQEDKDNPGTYNCVQDGGGLVISHDTSLKGIERGYFNVYSMKDDWIMTGDVFYIDNAHLIAITKYHIFYPSIDKHIDNLENPFTPSVNRVASGYIDLEIPTENPIFLNKNGSPTNVKLVYDETRQYPDTLNLQFRYASESDGGQRLTSSDGFINLSCNISSLLSNREWKDSIVVMVDAGTKQERRGLKIKKADLMLPDFKKGHISIR